jgi:HEAT repeat protein
MRWFSVLLLGGLLFAQEHVSSSGASTDKQEIERLVNALRDDDPIMGKASSALISIGKPAVGMLLDAMKSKDKALAGKAAMTIGFIGDLSVLDDLCGMASDQSADVRAVAALAMGYYTRVNALECAFLTERLRDADPTVRAVAVDGFLMLSGAAKQNISALEDAAPALARLVADDDERVRRAADLALRELDSLAHKAIPVLLEITKTGKLAARGVALDLACALAPNDKDVDRAVRQFASDRSDPLNPRAAAILRDQAEAERDVGDQQPTSAPAPKQP